MQPSLYIVVPCYNEQEVLPITAPLFRRKLLQLIADGKISDESRILFVNDGSKDRTWEIICAMAENPHTHNTTAMKDCNKCFIFN